MKRVIISSVVLLPWRVFFLGDNFSKAYDLFIDLVKKERCISAVCLRTVAGIETLDEDFLTFKFSISFLTFCKENSVKSKSP